MKSSDIAMSFVNISKINTGQKGESPGLVVMGGDS